MDIKYARHKVFATQRAPFSKVVGRTSNGNSHARGASIAPPVRVTRPPEVRVHAIRPYRTLAYPGRATVSVACCVRHASFAMRTTFGDRPAFTSPRRDKHGRPPEVRVHLDSLRTRYVCVRQLPHLSLEQCYLAFGELEYMLKSARYLTSEELCEGFG